MKMIRNKLSRPWVFQSNIYLVIVATFMLQLLSCVLYISTPYYLPSAPGGTVIRQMQPNTKSVILFEREGITIGINTSYGGEGQLNASFSFEIPDGKVVLLVEHHIEVLVSSTDSWKSEISGWVWNGPGRTTEYPLEKPMIGENAGKRFGTSAGYGRTGHKAFFFKALLFAKPNSNEFKIKMPRFIVNNIEVNLPLIKFTYRIEKLWTSLP